MKKLLILVGSILLLTGCFGGDDSTVYVNEESNLEITFVESDGYITEFSETMKFTDEDIETSGMEKDEFMDGMKELGSLFDEVEYYEFDVNDNSVILTMKLLKMDPEVDMNEVSEYGTLTDKGIEKEEFLSYLEENGFKKK